MKTKFNNLEEIDNTKNPFKVPENYFAQFNEEIMNLLPEKEVVSPRQMPLWGRVKPWVYLAAMFVGLYITINYLTKIGESDNAAATNQTAQSQQALTGVPDTENYWSTVQITEEEFYLYLEEQLVNDGYFDYMYHQFSLN
jgi:hypothetical protein